MIRFLPNAKYINYPGLLIKWKSFTKFFLWEYRINHIELKETEEEGDLWQ
jgi:hypothetical protein